MMTGNLMGQSIAPLRRWRKHQPLDHRQLNEPVEAINRMITGVGVPRQVIGRVGAPAAAVSLVAQFKLTQSGADFPDHLVCRTWDGETLGDEDVLVAKPWSLRRTPFDDIERDGVIYEYITNVERWVKLVSNLDVVERQTIAKRYLVGDILDAVTAIEGGTSVMAGEVPVTWLDLNVDTRDWKTVYETLE